MKQEKPKRWIRFVRPAVNKRDLSRRVKLAEDATTKHARRFIVRRLDNLREARRHVTLWLLVVGVIISAAGLQQYWYSRDYRVPAVSSGGIYAEGVVGPIDSLNPLFVSSKAEEASARLLFSSLLAYDHTGKLGYDIAESMAINAAGTEYTLKIRTNALWHDGFRVTANDIVFTVELLKNPSLRSSNQEDWTNIEVRALDDQTVVFKLPSVIAAFSHALTFPILPRHLLSSVSVQAIRENEFSASPIGSGPFRFRLAQDTNTILGHKVVYLERNNDYYRGVPRLERFQLHIYSSNEAILEGLKSNEINAGADLAVTNLDRVDKERYAIASVPVQSGVYTLFNNARDILKDKRVRQALQLGLDTQAIRDAFPGGKPELDTPLIPGQLDIQLPSAPEYSVSAATSLLDQAGWVLKDGTRYKGDIPLKLTLATTKDVNIERVLELVVGQWRALGVEIETLTIDLTGQNQQAAQDLIQSRNYDAIIYQLKIGADPDVYAYWHSSQIGVGKLNLANYSNQIVDDALLSARARTEQKLRDAKYLTFVNQWLQDVPAIGLYQSTTYYAYNKSDSVFEDRSAFVTPLDRFGDVIYWSAGKQNVYKTP